MLIAGLNESLLLIALCMGYLVMYLAKREEKTLQFIGYIIGSVVIALAGICIIFSGWIQANIGYAKMRHHGPRQEMMQQRMMRPQMMPDAPMRKK